MIWDYPNITQPTRAQLIALVPRAKQRLARLEKRDRRREKNKKRENLLPAVYVQQGSFHTATSTWSKVLLQEKGETAQTPIEIESNGFYRVSVSGTAVGGAQNKLRIVPDDVHQQVILDGDLGPAGTFGHFVDTDLTTGSRYILQHRGTTSATFVVTVEVITLAWVCPCHLTDNGSRASACARHSFRLVFCGSPTYGEGVGRPWGLPSHGLTPAENILTIWMHINPLRANYCHTWHMENHPFLWRRIRRVRRIQVCMARKGLILKTIGNRKGDCAWSCSRWQTQPEKICKSQHTNQCHSLRTLYWFVLCNLQIFSGCVCHLEQLHAQSPFLFPIVLVLIWFPVFRYLFSRSTCCFSTRLFGYMLLCYFTWAAARSQQLLFVVLAAGLWCLTAGCHVKISPLPPTPSQTEVCSTITMGESIHEKAYIPVRPSSFSHSNPLRE